MSGAQEIFYDLYTVYKNEWDDEATQLLEILLTGSFLFRQSPSKNTMIALKERQDRRFSNMGRPSGLGPARHLDPELHQYK